MRSSATRRAEPQWQRLNLATTEVWNDRNNQRQEKTEWHRVVLWGKQAESLQEYLTKGKQIYVEGRLQTRQWDDKDGNKRYTTEIKADRITLLGGGSGGRGARWQRGARLARRWLAGWTSRRWSQSPTTTFHSDDHNDAGGRSPTTPVARRDDRRTLTLRSGSGDRR